MRGRGPNQIPTHKGARITPAYAGKSRSRTGPARGPWDHPRVCGEELPKGGDHHDHPGSPPRMRGRVIRRIRPRTAAGITPAYAGKSRSESRASQLMEDHPRVCGEESHGCTHWPTRRGSPPRMRGRVFDADYSILRSGITPAYAGKRNQFLHNFGQNGDHPRVCGEETKKIP